MRHPDKGTLRRMLDEPMFVRETYRRHIQSCRQCRMQVDEMHAVVEEVSASLAIPSVSINAAAALAAVQARSVAEGSRQVRNVALPRSRRLSAMFGGTGAAVALAGIMIFTPAGAWTSGLITIFQPKAVQAVEVSSSDLRALPDLRAYGSVHVQKSVTDRTFARAQDAAAAAGISVAIPSNLPAGVPANATYHVTSGQTGSFTFSAAKARERAVRVGKQLPATPPRIDGSTLRVAISPAVVAVYGSETDTLPDLVIGQVHAPIVTASGASVPEMENYVLSLPGVPPRLAQELRSINDLTRTLPLVIPMDRVHSHSVEVQGAHGVAIGDGTGVGSAVIWERDGVIHGVAGTMSEAQILTVADGLK